MITLHCDIEFLYDKNRIICTTIDLSAIPEMATSALDCLLEGKLNGILLQGENREHSVILRDGNNVLCKGDPIEMHLSRSDCEIIRNMLLDVFAGNGFSGYHYDMSLDSNGCETDVCFVLC